MIGNVEKKGLEIDLKFPPFRNLVGPGQVQLSTPLTGYFQRNHFKEPKLTLFKIIAMNG